MELFGDREALYAMPEVFPAALFDYPGVKQLFYSGPAWRGRPTRVFACCGVPGHSLGRLPLFFILTLFWFPPAK